VLLGWSVAGMGWSMLLSADPDASVGVALGATGLAAAGTVFAYFLYRPLFEPPQDGWRGWSGLKCPQLAAGPKSPRDRADASARARIARPV